MVSYLIIQAELEYAFFISWNVALYAVSVPFLCYNIATHLKCKKYIEVLSDFNNQFLKIIGASKYILITMLCSTVILTYDRVWLNYIGCNSDIVSMFQFVDVLSNVYFLGITSIIYYYTPSMIKIYSSREGVNVFEKNFNMGGYLLLAAYFVFISFGLLCLYATGRGTLDYVIVFCLVSLLKSSIVLLGIIANYLLAVGREKFLAKIYSSIVCILIVLLYLLFPGLDYIYLPTLAIALIFISIFIILRFVKRGGFVKSTDYY